MTDLRKEHAIAFTRDRIAELDTQIAKLVAERKSAVTFLQSITGEEMEPVDVPGVEVQPSSHHAPSSHQEGRAYHSRQFNQRVVDEALDIIEKHGEPLSAPEIHRTHSKRDQVPTEVLYRLLYNRVLSGSLMSLNGAFWFEGRDLPTGNWDLSTAKRGQKVIQQ